MAFRINKKLVRWFRILVLSYSVIGIGIYYAQDYILFRPKPFSADHTFHLKNNFTEVNIPLNKTDSINILQLHTSMPKKGVVVYYHGNRSNVERYAKFADPFLKNGYDVWMPDYPGYGKSTGTLTEKKLYSMAYQVQQLAQSRFAKDSIIIYGKSLGTGIAAYAASATPCKALILETPYYSIPDIFRSYAFMYPLSRMITWRIPTWQFLQDVKVPVIILHGTNDGVIRYRSASKLKAYLKPGDVFYTIPGGSHRTINKDPVYFKAMDSLLSPLPALQ